MPQSGQDSGFWLVFADLYDGFNFKRSAANITNMKQKTANTSFTVLVLKDGAMISQNALVQFVERH
jgi:hypothetical protein